MKLYFFVIFFAVISLTLACMSKSLGTINLNMRTLLYEAHKLYVHNNKYSKALNYSLLFMEAQRSGKLPKDNRIPWRGDSALGDRGWEGEDLTGGYYDGTTTVKFIWPMAFTSTLLSWGVILWEDAFIAIDQIGEAQKAIRWATDFFIKCHVKPNVLYVQVGSLKDEQMFWERPEDINGTIRRAYQINDTHPASEVAADVAAALAAASIVFRNVDSAYSAECLRHATDLFKLATDHPGALIDSVPGPWEFYGYGGELEYIDELIWSAFWMYKATNETMYLDKANDYYTMNFTLLDVSRDFYFDRKTIAVDFLLAEYFKEYYHLYDIISDKLSTNARYTLKGLDYRDSTIFNGNINPLPYAANKAFIYLLLANHYDSKSSKYKEYTKYARTQIDYILGSQGRNFVVGYDDKSPKHPYHRASSCPDIPQTCGWEYCKSPDSNPQILYGALVAGPDDRDNYLDEREITWQSNVALFFNAGFTSALAGLLHEDLMAWDAQNKYSKIEGNN